MELNQYQKMGELKPTIVENSKSEEKTASVCGNGPVSSINNQVDELIRDSFEEEIDQLEEDGKELIITEVTFTSDDVPEIQYVLVE